MRPITAQHSTAQRSAAHVRPQHHVLRVQVRKRQHDERGRQALGRQDPADRIADPSFDPAAPLRVVCHPAVRLRSLPPIPPPCTTHIAWHTVELYIYTVASLSRASDVCRVEYRCVLVSYHPCAAFWYHLTSNVPRQTPPRSMCTVSSRHARRTLNTAQHAQHIPQHAHACAADRLSGEAC